MNIYLFWKLKQCILPILVLNLKLWQLIAAIISSVLCWILYGFILLSDLGKSQKGVLF